MKPISVAVPTTLTEADRAALARAKEALEHQPLAMKLAAAVGAPIERLIERLPASAHDTVAAATRIALEKLMNAFTVHIVTEVITVLKKLHRSCRLFEHARRHVCTYSADSGRY